jgi:uncharacterized protein (TIGR03032 family)
MLSPERLSPDSAVLSSKDASAQDSASTSELSTSSREVRYEYSPSFASLLDRLHVSLFISTYQAGKLVAVSAQQGALTLTFHNFQQVMGVAAGPAGVAVGTQGQIWFLQSAPDIAPKVEPLGQHDACFLTRRSFYTGEIQVHELAWSGEELWIVNTAFSCLCTLHESFSFVPQWRPPFVTALAAEDRCHLNGLAMMNGRPEYVTALGQTDAPQAWRPGKVTDGCLVHVPTGRVVASGFAMPHSPRVHHGRVWLLNSGHGRLVTVDPATGGTTNVADLPGYTRGLAVHESVAFVGLSKIRETATFGGMPIAEKHDLLKCGVGAIDLTTGRLLGHLEFVSGVDEIFDVQVLSGIRSPVISGPFPIADGGKPIWRVPHPSDPT